MERLFKDMDEVKAYNAAQGYNYFSPETMLWWKSKVESSLISGRYFITSEDDWRGNRIYCAREALADGRIRTIKTHLETKADAKEAINDAKRELGGVEEAGQGAA